MMKNTQGFTLIEFIIGNFLAIILLLIMIALFERVSGTYNHLKTLGHMREDARFVIGMFIKKLQNRDIRCLKKNTWDTDSAIHGYRHDLPFYLQNAVEPNTDVLEITGCDGDTSITTAYFLADSHRKNARGQTIFALYQKRKGGIREEIISNVENMSLEFGIACQDSRNICSYQQAHEVKDWRKVSSVGISFLSISEIPLLSYPISYQFNGQSYAADLRLRQKSIMYVALRKNAN